MQRDAHYTETVLFTMFLAFLLYEHETEACNMTWPMAHEVNRYTFWKSCTLSSWKRPFLYIMRNFWYSWLTEMRILVGEILHTCMEITIKMPYLPGFLFSFCQAYVVNKGRHYSAGGKALHMFHGHYSTPD